uniref:FA complementation group D2 n=1 Tax=Pygocentrus nattereri TaxID=42514 RepID=A0AAR2LHF0_PYGNA
VPVKGALNASADQQILDNFMLPTLWEQFGDESKKRKSTGMPSKAAVSDQVPDSVFVHMLQESGVILRLGNMSNEIAVDQVVFQKRLQQHLRKDSRYPSVSVQMQVFVFGCFSAVQYNAIDHVVLTTMISTCSTMVINTLFEKLPEFMFEGVGEDGLNIPRVIINQLKWLDRVVDFKDLANKLMQLVSVAPIEIQRDIITSLPEILEDSQHGDMARELNALLQENTQLTVPILDALSSLNISTALLAEVRGAVMSTVSAVQLEDLPIVVKFILHSISASDANEVVSDLRKKLELEQCVVFSMLQASQSSGKNKKSTASKDSVALVLEVIKSAVRFQKTISEAWLKVSRSFTVVDVLVLLILHSTNANQSRRGAERVLRAKVRAGLIQESLLNKTFKGYVMRGYFPSILALAQGLLRSPDCCVVPFGGHMYKQAFTAFDSYCQQEVVGSLVTHVCSGVSGEVDVALELLCELVSQKPTEMSQYAVFVKGILDYMENLNPQQIRRLFHLLSSLAFGHDKHGSHIQDDMHIVIRKQLSSAVPKYKRIGIIGAVMMVGSMGARRCGLQSLMCDCVTTLLELVRSCSEGSAEAAALYYDELANLLQTCKLDPLVWIGKSVLEDFQEDFVVDLGPEIAGLFPFPASVMYNLDEDESQGGIAVNLLPLMSQDVLHRPDNRISASQRNGRHVSPLCLSSFFRLLRLCEEEQHHGDLEEIDALLGCPLILTDMEVVERVESLSKAEREFFCSLLFYTINWFREVVNAFCKQTDPEMKMKVVTRLQNITYLQTLLETCLAASPGYTPPLANFDCESAEVLFPISSTASAKKAKKGKGIRCIQEAAGGDFHFLQSQASQQKEKEKEVKVGVSLSLYWPFFRELDVEVMNVLQCGLLSRSILDTELHSKVREEVQLGPSELVFLLEDMCRKLDFSLTAAPAKKAPFLKVKADKTVGFSHLRQKSSKDVAAYCIQLLPTLCTHLENCHNHFQTFLTEKQGVVDALGVDVKEQQLMSSAYQLLLQVLHTTFSWSGFSQPEQRVLLKSALKVLASRLKEEGTDQTLEQLISRGQEGRICCSSFYGCILYLSVCLSVYLSVCLSVCLSCLSICLVCLSVLSVLSVYLSCLSCLSVRPSIHLFISPSPCSIYLDHADDVLKAVEEIAGEGIPELMNAAKDASSRSWPTLSRQTFLVYYKVMMTKLEKSVRKLPPGKQTDSRESEKLLTWSLAVRDFHILINLVKVEAHNSYGRLFLESFLKLGMPLLDYSFKKHKEDVQSLLKTFQLSTRQLHHMCGHSKIQQDTALTNHVPALKKSLEQFVYRVKAMLTLNQCQEAFWLGNLKNRDLKVSNGTNSAFHNEFYDLNDRAFFMTAQG